MNYPFKRADHLFSGQGPVLEDLFQARDKAALTLLRSMMDTTRFDRGTYVYRYGEAPKSIYILRSGSAQFETKNIVGFELPVQVNHICGVTELIASDHYLYDLKAMSNSNFDVINRVDFVGFLRKQPSICFRLSHFIASEYSGLICLGV